MIWNLVILLGTALSADSYAVHDLHERLAHGRQLKIYLPKSVEKLEFTPADEPRSLVVYWENGRHRYNKGRVSGTGNDRRWYIDKVTYADEGTYTQKDYWNKELSTVKVAVIPRNNKVERIPGETLYISLEGLALSEASLYFEGEAANVTLVRDGSPVAQDISYYWDRVKTHTMNIEIRGVNTSDVGRYTMRDRRNRVVSITRMDLTDHHETSEGNPLLALLLLLGIPAGICCCCRKKIFKQKASTTATQGTPETAHASPSGPAGPPPAYHTPGQPGAVYYHGPDPSMGSTVHPPPNPAGPGQWNGPPPAAGFNPAYPPQNPVYPPAGPAMVPPGPGAPMYYPGAPMGYAPAPVMYSNPPPTAASEPVKEEVKMENMVPSPADPLMTTPPQAETAVSPVAPTPPLSSSDGAYQFKIDTGTNNFL